MSKQLFKHPSLIDGKIHFEDASYEVRAGVVECPVHIGAGAQWPLPSPEDAAAYREAIGAGDGLRQDGPTFEEWVERGYKAEAYPPRDYAEKPSDGLTAFRAQQARAAAIVKVLDGKVDEVAQALVGPVEGQPLTLDELAALEAAEKNGKDRKGVFDAIAARLEALTAPPVQ